MLVLAYYADGAPLTIWAQPDCGLYELSNGVLTGESSNRRMRGVLTALHEFL